VFKGRNGLLRVEGWLVLEFEASSTIRNYMYDQRIDRGVSGFLMGRVVY